MKRIIKRTVSFLSVLCLLCVLLFEGAALTVSADTDIDFNQPTSLSTGYVYLYDETGKVSEDDFVSLYNSLVALNNASGFKVGMYIGSVPRTKAEGAEVATGGSEYLDFNGYGASGGVFVYLDCSENNGESDYIYCYGDALQYYYIEGDGKADICRLILKNAREYQYDDDYSEAKHIDHVAGFTIAQLGFQYYYPSDLGEDLINAEESLPEESSEPEVSYAPYDPRNFETPAQESVPETSKPETYVNPEKTEPAYYGKNKELLYPGYVDTSFRGDDYADLREYMGETAYLVDEGAMFSTEQAKTIFKAMNDASAETGFNIVIFVGSKSRSDYVIEDMAFQGAQSIFGTKVYNGTVYLYADFDGYSNAYDHMFCSNDAFLYYTNGDDGTPNRVSDILYIMEDHFPPGGQQPDVPEVVKGFEAYCTALKDFKKKGLVEGIYYIDPATGDYVYASFGKIVHSRFRPYKYWWAGLLIGLAVGAIAAVCISATIKSRYKFRSAASASLYTSRNNMIMRDSQDEYLGSHMTRVRIQSSSGGGGFHGGGGGHFGGGGGGHHR